MPISQRRKLELIDSVLAAPFPEGGVVRSSPGGEQANVKLLYFRKNNNPWLIVEDRDESDLICSVWNGSTHADRVRFSMQDFADDEYKIKHYFGLATIYFENLAEYDRALRFRLPYIRLYASRLFDRAGQAAYNRRKIVSTERVELLRFMLEQSINGKNSFSSLGLMTDLHSLRWLSHPEGESSHHRLEMNRPGNPGDSLV